MNVPVQAGPAVQLPASGLSLRANFAWSLAGNVSYAAAQWLTVVALARIGDAQMVGAYSLALAISSPVFLLVNLHLRTMQATDTGRHYRLESYLGLRLITLTLALATMAAVAFLAPFAQLTRLVLIPVALTRAAESVSDILYGHHQRSEKMDLTGKSMFVRSAGSLAVLGLFLYAGSGLLGAALASFAVSCGVTVYDLLRFRMEHGAFPAPDFRTGALRPLVTTSLSLAVIMAVASFNANAPRLFLAKWQSESEVGVFSALALLVVSANVLVLALGQAAAPAMSRAYAAGDFRAFCRSAGPLVGLAALLGLMGAVGAVWAGPPAVEAVYGPSYSLHCDLIAWLFWGGAIGYLNSACGYVLSSARWFQQQIGPLVAVGMVTALLCALLIPRLGTKGAAMAQLAGAATQLLLSAALVAHCVKKHFPEVRLA
ncbi:MAG: oligosaccharide flippase family protein [Bryobacteraceae bacterium]|nr:oligosaccharide flippase family protein [Bryobacteraceae bacterium]